MTYYRKIAIESREDDEHCEMVVLLAKTKPCLGRASHRQG
jgi:hypothetical protein